MLKGIVNGVLHSN